VGLNREIPGFIGIPARLGSTGDLARIILLDCSCSVEVLVEGTIRDAEAAHAQHVLDPVLIA
jgi:hypothetical protein